MQKTIKRGIAWILAVFMALACLAVVPTVVADTAPTIDGVKDDSYTDDKLLTVTEAWPGANQPSPTQNTTGTTIKTWYTWDDTNNYFFMEITEDAFAGDACLDLLYFSNDYVTLGGGFVGAAPTGGYIQFTPSTGAATTEGGTVRLTEYASKYSDDKTTRAYEIVMPKASANAKGFMISPVVYFGGTNYVVAYNGFYNDGTTFKVLSYTDQATWQESKGAPVGNDDVDDGKVAVDGFKDAEYTDAKKIAVYNAYQGTNLIKNMWKTSAELWFTWDEDTIYAYMEVNEKIYTFQPGNKDYINYSSKTDLPSGELGLWQMPSSGSKGWNVTNADSPNIGELRCNATSMTCTSDGTFRTYELSFPRDAASDGFILSPLLDKTDYVVNMDEKANKSAHVIKFADESTWTATYGEPFDDNTGGGGTDDGPREPATNCEGIDGVKDDRYSDDKQIIISKHFAGTGGGMITNTRQNTINLFYAWDDVNNYFLMEVHEPIAKDGADHRFAYIPVVSDGFGQNYLEVCPGGGYLSFKNGELIAEINESGIKPQYAVTSGDNVTTYEIVIPKAEETSGFMVAPRIINSGTSIIAHHTLPQWAQNAITVNYENDSTWFVDASDPDVLTDLSIIEEIKTEIAKIPADVATLTLADHQELVVGVHEAMAELRTAWLDFFTADERALATAAYAKIMDLLAEISGAEIKAVEDAIKALPETVTLADSDAVNEVKAAVDELGDLIQYADQTLVEKLNALLANLAKQAAVVHIDGVKDDAYDASVAYPVMLEFIAGDIGNVISVFPATYGALYTMADNDYSYVYFEVFDATGINVLDEGEPYVVHHCDAVFIYFDPDPDNRPIGIPYQDASEPSDGMFTFTFTPDGVLRDLGAKTEFLKDPANFQAFKSEDGLSYGFEMRVPRVEDQESFAMNAVIMDMIEDPDGQVNMAESRYIAIGQYWAGDYSAYASLFYDEIPEVMTYLEIVESIEDLPAPESITSEEDITSSLKRKVRNLNQSMTMLNAEQSAMVSDELKAKLAALTDIVENGFGPVGPAVTYGDVNGDGNINAEDALWVLQAAVSKRTLNEAQTTAADVDGSGALDAVDALMILQKAVNKIEKFPVEQ